jgi:hypothetical protein
LGSGESGAITGKRDRSGGHVLEILTDALKEHGSPAIAAESAIAIPMIGILSLSSVTAKSTVVGRPVRSSVLSGWVTAPPKIERISFGATGRVFDANYGRAAISRVRNKLLSAPAIHFRKSEIGGIRRHDRSAFEAAPLRRLSREIPENRVTAANLYFSRSIDDHFDGAFAAIRVAAAHENRAARESLSTGDSRRRNR